MTDRNTTSWLNVEPNPDDPRIVTLHINFPMTPLVPLPPLSVDDAVKYMIAAMHDGPTDDLRRAFVSLREEDGGAYRKVLEAVATCERVSDAFRNMLHSDWVEVAHNLRANVRDDDLIIRAFRRIFPLYTGSGVVLFRGQRASEFEAGNIGLNWSAQECVGLTFARRLSSLEGCKSVLLTVKAEPSAIIVGPNDHSTWIDEAGFIVEPRKLSGIKIVDWFSPEKTGY